MKKEIATTTKQESYYRFGFVGLGFSVSHY